MTELETSRVALIRYRSARGVPSSGSGLLVDGSRVLTADHLAAGTGHSVMCQGGRHDVVAVLRSGTPDVDLAVLTLAAAAEMMEPIGCAVVSQDRVSQVSGCVAVGFPRWRRSGERRLSAQVDGHVPTAEGLEQSADAGLRAGLLTLVGNRNPRVPDIPAGMLTDAGANPWGGMSGAGVVAGGLLIGVVRSHNLAAGGQSLTFTPLSALSLLPAGLRQRFWAAIGVTEPGRLTVLPRADRPDGGQPASAAPRQPFVPEPRVIQVGQWANCVAISPDGALLAAGSRSRVRLWHLDSGRAAWQSPVMRWSSINSVAFSPDGAWLVSGGSDKTTRIWDVATGAERLRIRQGGWVNAVTFSPDGTRVASACNHGQAGIGDALTGIEQLRVGHQSAVLGIAFSPDGRQLVTASHDGTVRIWDASTGAERLCISHGSSVSVQAVAFSPDGARLATGSKTLDGRVTGPTGAARLLDAATGAELLCIRHRQSLPVTAVAFSPDGARLATGSDDSTAQVWDAATGAGLLSFAHGNVVHGVAFSPDGSRVVTAAADSTVRVWDAPA